MGSLLDTREGLVDLEHVRKVVGALFLEEVALNTANEPAKCELASMGADGVNGSQFEPSKGSGG